MNLILRDCVELHPQAGHHMPGPLAFPRVVIASLVIETPLSPSPPSGYVGAPPLTLSLRTTCLHHLSLSNRFGGRLRSLLPHHSYHQLVIPLPSSTPLTSFLYRGGEQFHPSGHLSRCIGSLGTLLP